MSDAGDRHYTLIGKRGRPKVMKKIIVVDVSSEQPKTALKIGGATRIQMWAIGICPS